LLICRRAQNAEAVLRHEINAKQLWNDTVRQTYKSGLNAE